MRGRAAVSPGAAAKMNPQKAAARNRIRDNWITSGRILGGEPPLAPRPSVRSPLAGLAEDKRILLPKDSRLSTFRHATAARFGLSSCQVGGQPGLPKGGWFPN